MKLSELGQAALFYVQEWGVPIFPCVLSQKNPLIPTGFKGASRNPQQIEEWWDKTPTANIAMPTGHVSNRFVIDFDNKPEKGIDGRATWQRLVVEHGDVEAPTVLTPSGGNHLHFKHTDGLGCTSGALGPGIDTRGDGGYVLLPPSIVGGRPYEEDLGASFDDIPLPPVPQWVIDLLPAKAHREVAEIPPSGKPLDLASLEIDDTFKYLLLHGDSLKRYQSRSEAVFKIEKELVQAGYGNADIAAILMDPTYALSEKPIERGKKWVYDDIKRARAGTDGASWTLTADTNKRRNGKVTNIDLTPAVLSYQELLTRPIKDRVRLLPWLSERAIAMIYGERGVGKTQVALSVAISLTTASELFGWKSLLTEILYVDGEMPLEEVRERIRKLTGNKQPEGLHILASEVFYEQFERDLTLTKEIMRDAVNAYLDEHPTIRVVILDNISTLFTGMSEDKKQDWEPINAWLIRLRHRGVSPVLIHHAGKGGQQRGTSGREDILDTVIALRRPANYDPKEGCRFNLHFTKSRGTAGIAVQALEAKIVPRWIDGEEIWNWDFKQLEESQKDQVIALLNDGENSNRIIAEEVGCTERYVRRIKRDWDVRKV